MMTIDALHNHRRELRLYGVMLFYIKTTFDSINSKDSNNNINTMSKYYEYENMSNLRI